MRSLTMKILRQSYDIDEYLEAQPYSPNIGIIFNKPLKITLLLLEPSTDFRTILVSGRIE